jgi:hypothetical protein
MIPIGYQVPLRAPKLAILALMVAAVQPAVAGPVESLSPGTWYEVPNSPMSAVDPCPQGGCSWSANEGQAAVMNDWSGGVFATAYGASGGLMVWGGGHKGYYGSELYIFDVGALQWRRLSDPTVNPVCNLTTSELQDGSPCAAHSYDYIDYDPVSNSFLNLGSTSDQDSAGGGTGNVHLFDLGSKSWRRGAQKPGPFVTETGAASAYDPNRNAMWLVPAYNQTMGKYEPNANGGAGKWTIYDAYNVEAGVVGAIDPGHDIMVLLDGAGTHRMVGINLKNPTERVLLNTAGDTAPQNVQESGFEWDSADKIFFSWIGGAEVYTLTPPATGDWRTAQWIWTKVQPASGNSTVPTAANDNGTYGRFNYVPALNVFVLVNRTTDNVFFYRLSAQVVRPLPPSNLQAQ